MKDAEVLCDEEGDAMNWEVKYHGRGAQFVVLVNTSEEHEPLLKVINKAVRGPAANAAMIGVEKLQPDVLRDAMEAAVRSQGAEIAYGGRGWRFVCNVNTDEDFLEVAKRINDDLGVAFVCNVIIVAAELEPEQVQEFMKNMAELEVNYYATRERRSAERH